MSGFVDFDPRKHRQGTTLYELRSGPRGGTPVVCAEAVPVTVDWNIAAKTPWYYVVKPQSRKQAESLLRLDRHGNPAGAARGEKEWRGQVRVDRHGRVVKRLGMKYSSTQPRVPRGESTGGRWTAGGGDADFEQAATAGNVASDRSLGGGITDSRLLEFRGDGRGVWKKDEAVNRADAEVLADRLDDALGLGIVPKTMYLTSKDGERGSCQRFVEDATLAMDLYDEGHEDDVYKGRDAVERMILLDYLTGNLDRHYGNVIFDKAGKMWAVDNGMADWKLKGGRGWVKDIEPEMWKERRWPLSPSLAAKVKAFDPDTFMEFVGSGEFHVEEWGALKKKVKEIQQTGELRW